MRNIILTFFLIIYYISNAQKIDISLGYNGFMDNREYINEYSEHQTFFGNRIYTFNSINKDNSCFVLGFDYTYEFGSLNNRFKPKLIANYQYKDDRFHFLFGSFQRNHLLDYPLALLTDSLIYYRPLIEGTLIKLNHPKGYQQAWLDWTGRQTDTIRETFLTGLSGHTEIGNFFIDNYILMYHHAKPAFNTNNLHIRDNGGMSISIGYNVTDLGFFDHISVKAGEIMTYDRDRGEYETRTYYSTFMELNLNVKKLLFSGSYYIGDGMVAMYGEKIYSAPHYARFNLSYYPFANHPENKLQFSIHWVEGEINYSQLINIKFNFDYTYLTLKNK